MPKITDAISEETLVQSITKSDGTIIKDLTFHGSRTELYSQISKGNRLAFHKDGVVYLFPTEAIDTIALYTDLRMETQEENDARKEEKKEEKGKAYSSSSHLFDLDTPFAKTPEPKQEKAVDKGFLRYVDIDEVTEEELRHISITMDIVEDELEDMLKSCYQWNPTAIRSMAKKYLGPITYVALMMETDMEKWGIYKSTDFYVGRTLLAAREVLQEVTNYDGESNMDTDTMMLCFAQKYIRNYFGKDNL